MVKLTGDLILRSAFYTNPLHERELDLRALRIPEIENLGVTRDAFDCIDLSSNDITVLGNFPLLTRLSTLLLSGNRVSTIAVDTFSSNLPNLQSLQLANNRISDIAEIGHLSRLQKLEHLWLSGNPIATSKDYRLRVIQLLPALRYLDGSKITKAERDSSRALPPL